MSYHSSLKFPYKLWKIVNECKSGAISWDSSGKVILINYKVFKRDYLDSDYGFKTANMSSLIRQLNLYGFRKISATSLQEVDRNVHAYQNDNFVYGNRSLLNFVCRKPSGVKRQNKLHSSPHNKHLIACRNAFSTALKNAANSNILSRSKRQLQFAEEKCMNELLFEKKMFPLPIEEEVDQRFETDDVLNEYNSLFNNEVTLFSDIGDTIPIILPQEIALDKIYILPSEIPASWNKYSNNQHSEDCISDVLENSPNKENEEEMGLSIREKYQVDTNEIAPVLPKIENEINMESPAAYSLVFDSSFAGNSNVVYWNVADDLAFPSSTAEAIVDVDEPAATQQDANSILNQNMDGTGYDDSLSSQTSTTAKSFFESYPTISDVEFV